jgi:hypothetical protein
MRRITQGVSPALVVAVLALIAALAGTAIAGPTATTSISKKKTKKIALNQANKVVDGVLPIGASELGNLREESETFQVNSGATVSQTVDCNSDEKVISGGSRWDNFQTPIFVITQEDRRDGNGWRAGGVNATGATQPFTVYAYCLEP